MLDNWYSKGISIIFISFALIIPNMYLKASVSEIMSDNGIVSFPVLDYDLLYQTEDTTVYINTATWEKVMIPDIETTFHDTATSLREHYILADTSVGLCILSAPNTSVSCLPSEFNSILLSKMFWSHDEQTLWLYGGSPEIGTKIWEIDVQTGNIIRDISAQVIFPNTPNHAIPILRTISMSEAIAAFTSRFSEQLYLVDLNDLSLIKVIPNNPVEHDYSLLNFSPDGNLMSGLSRCTHPCKPHLTIWDIKNDVQTTVNLVLDDRQFYSISEPQWSSDGSYIAFIALTDRIEKPSAVMLYEVATGRLSILVENEFEGYSLSWSPDDKALVQVTCMTYCEVSFIYLDGLINKVLNFSEQKSVQSYTWLPRNWLFDTDVTPTPEGISLKIAECISDRGIRTSLTAKINNAQWGAFINEVEAQRGKKIPEECAVELIEMAQYLLENE